MHAARLRELRRRPRRGSLDRPINGRLVRTSLLVLLLPVAVAGLTVSRGGPLPAPSLPPSFDGTAAMSLTTALARQYPSRVPGSSNDQGAAGWFSATLAQYGLVTESDVWRQRVPGLGRVQLRNLAVVIPGSAKGAIVFVAHRDTSGLGTGANDDATGTAALIQLARSYAPSTSTQLQPKPLHTLVFLSTDAGAWGSLGAQRFVTRSRFRGDLLAAVVLDGLAGIGLPRIDIGGDDGRSPAPALVRTTVARVSEQIGARPKLPGLLRQLVDLGVPYGYGEQATFLGHHVSSLRIATADDSGRSDVADRPGLLVKARLTRLGAATQNLLGSLDAAGELAQGSTPAVYLHGRVVRGWALSFVLISLLIPFLAGVVDLLARTQRLGAPLAPGLRALRRRLGFWGTLGALVWFGALVGFFPAGPAAPLPPRGPTATDWPVTGLAVLAGTGVVAWFVSRRRLVPLRPPDRAEELAGYSAALLGLGATGSARRDHTPARAGLPDPVALRLAVAPAGREPGVAARPAVRCRARGAVAGRAVRRRPLRSGGAHAPLPAAAGHDSATSAGRRWSSSCAGRRLPPSSERSPLVATGRTPAVRPGHREDRFARASAEPC